MSATWTIAVVGPCTHGSLRLLASLILLSLVRAHRVKVPLLQSVNVSCGSRSQLPSQPVHRGHHMLDARPPSSASAHPLVRRGTSVGRRWVRRRRRVNCFSVRPVVCVLPFRLRTAQIPQQLIEAYRCQVRCKRLAGIIVFVKSRQQYRVVPVFSLSTKSLKLVFIVLAVKRLEPLLLSIELCDPLPPQASALVVRVNVPASAPVL
jgi:hypothetical protein